MRGRVDRLVDRLNTQDALHRRTCSVESGISCQRHGYEQPSGPLMGVIVRGSTRHEELSHIRRLYSQHPFPTSVARTPQKRALLLAHMQRRSPSASGVPRSTVFRAICQKHLAFQVRPAPVSQPQGDSSAHKGYVAERAVAVAERLQSLPLQHSRYHECAMELNTRHPRCR